jgi:hypothetical protein
LPQPALAPSDDLFFQRARHNQVGQG